MDEWDQLELDLDGSWVVLDRPGKEELLERILDGLDLASLRPPE